MDWKVNMSKAVPKQCVASADSFTRFLHGWRQDLDSGPCTKSGTFLFKSLYDLLRQRREACVQGGVSERRDTYRQGSFGCSNR